MRREKIRKEIDEKEIGCKGSRKKGPPLVARPLRGEGGKRRVIKDKIKKN